MKLPPAAREFTYIGHESACPHCGVILNPVPQRKASCPHCAGVVHARTRPIDERKVLLKPSDLAQLELEWSLDYRIKQVFF